MKARKSLLYSWQLLAVNMITSSSFDFTGFHTPACGKIKS